MCNDDAVCVLSGGFQPGGFLAKNTVAALYKIRAVGSSLWFMEETSLAWAVLMHLGPI